MTGEDVSRGVWAQPGPSWLSRPTSLLASRHSGHFPAGQKGRWPGLLDLQEGAWQPRPSLSQATAACGSQKPGESVRGGSATRLLSGLGAPSQTSPWVGGPRRGRRCCPPGSVPRAASRSGAAAGPGTRGRGRSGSPVQLASPSGHLGWAGKLAVPFFASPK